MIRSVELEVATISSISLKVIVGCSCNSWNAHTEKCGACMSNYLPCAQMRATRKELSSKSAEHGKGQGCSFAESNVHSNVGFEHTKVSVRAHLILTRRFQVCQSGNH